MTNYLKKKIFYLFIFITIFLIPKMIYFSLIFPFMSKINFKSIFSFFKYNYEFIFLFIFILFSILSGINLKVFYEFIVILLIAYFYYSNPLNFKIEKIIYLSQIFLFFHLLTIIFTNNFFLECEITRLGFFDLIYLFNYFKSFNLDYKPSCAYSNLTHISYYVGINLFLLSINSLCFFIKKKNIFQQIFNFVVFAFCVISSIYLGNRLYFILLILNSILISLNFSFSRKIKSIIFLMLTILFFSILQLNMNFFFNEKDMKLNSKEIYLHIFSCYGNVGKSDLERKPKECRDHHETNFERFTTSKLSTPRLKEYKSVLIDKNDNSEISRIENFLFNVDKSKIYHNYFLTLISKFGISSVLIFLFIFIISLKLCYNLINFENNRLLLIIFLINFFFIFNVTTLMGYSKHLFVTFFIILSLFFIKSGEKI